MDWRTAAGDLLREQRRAAGLSQRALAQLAGTSQAEVARIEAHRSQPTLPVLGHLLDVLGADLVLRPKHGVRPTLAVEVADDIRGLLRSGDTSRQGIAECYRSAAAVIDAQRHLPGARFWQAVSLAPETTGSRNFDALIAALVEDCCRRTGVDPPSWVDEEARFVEGEWFPSGFEALHDAARRQSPPAFRRHGVFVLEDEISQYSRLGPYELTEPWAERKTTSATTA